MATPESPMASQPHYPYVTRSLIDLYAEGRLTNVSEILVEPEYGYLARISYANGAHRITYGNDLGLNTGSAGELAKDKGHTKFLLRALGINCPAGDEFLLPWWAETMGGTGRLSNFNNFRTTAMADPYVEEQLGYPVYVKPVDGSKGGDVHKVHDAEELTGVFAGFQEKRVRVAMVEEPIGMPDYRIVTLDGEAISAYRRVPLSVTGNGTSTVVELLAALQERYVQEGRDTRIDVADPRIKRKLQLQGYDLRYVPPAGTDMVLSDISNLSAGGTSQEVSHIIHSRWTELAAEIARNFNLRICGVDLACADITSADADYSVLEVNAAPGLDHYASSGSEQKRIVQDLYTKVFNALP